MSRLQFNDPPIVSAASAANTQRTTPFARGMLKKRKVTKNSTKSTTRAVVQSNALNGIVNPIGATDNPTNRVAADSPRLPRMPRVPGSGPIAPGGLVEVLGGANPQRRNQWLREAGLATAEELEQRRLRKLEALGPSRVKGSGFDADTLDAAAERARAGGRAPGAFRKNTPLNLSREMMTLRAQGKAYDPLSAQLSLDVRHGEQLTSGQRAMLNRSLPTEVQTQLAQNEGMVDVQEIQSEGLTDQQRIIGRTARKVAKGDNLTDVTTEGIRGETARAVQESRAAAEDYRTRALLEGQKLEALTSRAQMTADATEGKRSRKSAMKLAKQGAGKEATFQAMMFALGQAGATPEVMEAAKSTLDEMYPSTLDRESPTSVNPVTRRRSRVPIDTASPVGNIVNETKQQFGNDHAGAVEALDKIGPEHLQAYVDSVGLDNIAARAISDYSNGIWGSSAQYAVDWGPDALAGAMEKAESFGIKGLADEVKRIFPELKRRYENERSARKGSTNKRKAGSQILQDIVDQYSN